MLSNAAVPSGQSPPGNQEASSPTRSEIATT
jgi:hypothetical protein